jgi:hypothetical protein
MKYNAKIALASYLQSLKCPTTFQLPRIVCGFVTTSGKQGGWKLETYWLYADHTKAELQKWLDKLDVTYDYEGYSVVMVVNIELSDGTQHRFDASQFYTVASAWHCVISENLSATLKDKATHDAFDGRTCLSVPHGFIEFVKDDDMPKGKCRATVTTMPNGIDCDFVYFVVYHGAWDGNKDAVTTWAKAKVKEVYFKAKAILDQQHIKLPKVD